MFGCCVCMCCCFVVCECGFLRVCGFDLPVLYNGFGCLWGCIVNVDVCVVLWVVVLELLVLLALACGWICAFAS